MMVLLVIFGGTILAGGLLRGLTVEAVLFAVISVFFVRPLSGWVSLIGTKQRRDERAVISFFGIRGVGSAYYLSYGLNNGMSENPDMLWGATGLIILISIVLHGTTVTPAMQWLDRRSGRVSGDQIEFDLAPRL